MIIEDNEIFLEKTRQRLRAWGCWCQAIFAMGLNFSGKTIIEQLVNSKGVMVKSTIDNLAPENQEAEEIDLLVNQLAQYEPQIAKVLYIHYMTDELGKLKIKKAGVSRTTYFKYLSEAERWIHRQLD